VVNKRVDLTMPICYLEGMDLLIKDGLYENQAEIVKDALRRLFNHYDVKLLNPSALPEC
jgi:Arc/MetJ-type ribon-helix-helix transcriptional regulator